MVSNPYLRPIIRWWWLVVLGTLLAGGSAFSITRDAPLTYVADTTLIVGSNMDNPNPSGADVGMASQLAQIYADLASRDPIRTDTANALSLQSLPVYSVKVLPNSSLLDISVTDTDPSRAAAVANELAAQLVSASPAGARSVSQARQAFVDQQLNDLQKNITQTQTEIESTQSRLATLSSAVEITDTQNKLAALQSKLTSLQSNYASLLAVTSQGAVNSVAVVAPAATPTQPVGFSRPMLIALAALMGLALSVGTAHLLELLDNRVRAPDDVERITGWNVLGDMTGTSFEELIGTAHDSTDSGNSSNANLAAVLSSLMYSPTFEYMRSLVVTDLSEKGSSSLLGAYLAEKIAESGKNVALVEANFNDPTLDQSLGITFEAGMADYATEVLSGKKLTPGDLNQLIHKTETENLSIIGAGNGSKIKDHPSTFGLIRGVLQEISERYDLVIVVSPSFHKSPDPLALTRVTEGVIVAVDAGEVKRSALAKAAKELQAVPATVVGAVFNRPRRRLWTPKSRAEGVQSEEVPEDSVLGEADVA